ncbi:MAG: T9SS C-terminal target domain-containing protein [Ignavibacteriae bacterium]|nr:MAG: T9SS C-terminal target domain-containing protein [Ignavibacteriota bacterium]
MNFRSSINRVKVFIIPLLLLFSYTYCFSQDNRLKINHQLNYFPEKRLPKFSIFSLPETLTVYGVRVQFLADNDPNTTGDGRFDLSNNYPDSIDAPPHDSAYFAQHLEFVKNYYYKSSKGNLVIKFEMIGGVRSLPKTMSDYSPRRTEPNIQRLGSLFYDTWASVDSVYDFSQIPPGAAFVIFHAGVGRDVDLISQGIFQGELDLPSIYLSRGTLKSLYGDTTQGYYTKEGTIIPTSCILPEQESRVINSTFGDVYLELGMNGILTASVGSHLGLPDLFNTATGETAIGRFGLMDGQSLFSYSGVFPPEPSAWEKQYMGWVNPLVITSTGYVNSVAATLDDGNVSVKKFLIDAKEYFLVENRNRDARKDGVTVYYMDNGIPDSVKFTKDEDGFQNGDVWKLKKNIVDVDELDWSLPGLKNDTADYQGGLLIWHIDENVIDAKIASNTINTDMNHRGVDLEEAKGAQDIGVTINTPFGKFIGEGTPFDYWYNGNHYVPSTIYKNEFTNTSIPNSKSYKNINSRICIREIATADVNLVFYFDQCSGITNINSFPRFVGVDTSGNAQPIGFDYDVNSFDEYYVNVNGSLYGFRENGNPIRVDMPNGFIEDSVANYIIGFTSLVSPQSLYSVYGSDIVLLRFTIDSLTSEPIINRFNTGTQITTPAMFNRDNNDSLYIYAGNQNGRLTRLNLLSSYISSDSVSVNPLKLLAGKSTGDPGYTVIFIDNVNKFLTEGNFQANQTGQILSSSVIVNNTNNIVLGGNPVTQNSPYGNIYSSPTLADINKDKSQEIIFSAGSKIWAVNKHGVVIDHFPFSVTGVDKISSGISVADLNNDGIYDLIFGTADGRIYAYGSDGKILDGFPLLAGKEIKSTPAIVNAEHKFGILAYSQDGYLYGWKTSWDYNSNQIVWANYLKDINHSNINLGVTGNVVSGPCLPKEKFYNWPNPVYGKSTNIRYFLNGEASSIKVKIMDLSGELVATLTGTTNSGFDNEVVWDVSSVQSGIYIGVIEMEGGCGETASIKIAVVK